MQTNYRVLNAEIILGDEYRKIAHPAQSLYVTCLMSADEYGFLSNIHKLCCDFGYDSKDIDPLIKRGFLILFSDGTALISHWFCQTGMVMRLDPNRMDYYGTITLDSDGVFRQPDSPKAKKAKAFVPPTLEQVKAYAEERNSSVDAEDFFNYFNTPNENGDTWVDSRGKKVLNWKGKFVTWEKNRNMRRNNGRSNQRNTYAGAKGRSPELPEWSPTYTVDGTGQS